jgi:hypothetical protein
MRAMCRTEGIIHVHVDSLNQLVNKQGIIAFLAWIEPKVLQEFYTWC